jgi:hypothetical protein
MIPKIQGSFSFSLHLGVSSTTTILKRKENKHFLLLPKDKFEFAFSF